MATKKKKFKVTQVPVLTFNKKNTLALADLIYSDQGGVISLLKLCNGKLVNGKDGGRTTHCAVGEAYFTFVNRDMKKILKTKSEYDGGDYKSLYDVEVEGPTAAVIDALVGVAQFKNSNEMNKQRLATALDNAVQQNDSDVDSERAAALSFVERSQNVAEVFRKEVAPLLK